eukprot:2564086-Alexandrium_andersonii.AAC.1
MVPVWVSRAWLRTIECRSSSGRAPAPLDRTQTLQLQQQLQQAMATRRPMRWQRQSMRMLQHLH